MLDRGASIEAKVENGWTDLSMAARQGHKFIVECLLDRGANIEVRDQSGETPLLLACRLIDKQQKKFEILSTIELLCSKGANVSVKDKDGDTPLKHAKEVKDEKIREELISMLKKYGAKK